MTRKPEIQYVGQFYVHGSEARALALEEERKQAKARRPLARLQQVELIYVDPVAALGIVVAVAMLIMMVVGISQLRVEHKKTAEMEQRVEQLQMEKVALQAQYDEECDLEAIHKTALALGMIPQEDAVRIPIEIEVPSQELPRANLWQRIGTFLTGIFA
jgi:cell division protein FtsL